MGFPSTTIMICPACGWLTEQIINGIYCPRCVPREPPTQFFVAYVPPTVEQRLGDIEKRLKELEDKAGGGA